MKQIRPSLPPGLRRATSLAAVTTALATACGYHIPRAGLSVGVNAFPANVLYGSPAADVLPVALPIAPPLASESSSSTTTSASVTPVSVVGKSAGPRSPAPALPTPALPAAAPSDVCPAPRGSSVAIPADSEVVAAPRAASYPFRSTLRESSSASPNGAPVQLPEVRTINDVATSGNTITFDVVAAYPTIGLAESTAYQITTSSSVPSDQEDQVPLGTLSGVYITSQSVTTTPTRGAPSTTTVNWTPALQVLKLPASPGTSWAVTSADEHTGASESFTANVQALAEVNACGSLLQGYKVALTGTLVIPSQSYPLSFNETEIIAPQFGGLALGDEATTTSRTSPTTAATEQVTDAIDVTPELPAREPAG